MSICLFTFLRVCLLTFSTWPQIGGWRLNLLNVFIIWWKAIQFWLQFVLFFSKSKVLQTMCFHPLYGQYGIDKPDCTSMKWSVKKIIMENYQNNSVSTITTRFLACVHHCVSCSGTLKKSTMLILYNAQTHLELSVNEIQLIYVCPPSEAERPNSVVFRHCWPSILILGQESAGESFYMLFRAIKHQVDKGPVDAVTGKAKYTLNDNRLLREDVEYHTLVRTHMHTHRYRAQHVNTNWDWPMISVRCFTSKDDLRHITPVIDMPVLLRRP